MSHHLAMSSIRLLDAGRNASVQYGVVCSVLRTQEGGQRTGESERDECCATDYGNQDDWERG